MKSYSQKYQKSKMSDNYLSSLLNDIFVVEMICRLFSK